MSSSTTLHHNVSAQKPGAVAGHAPRLALAPRGRVRGELERVADEAAGVEDVAALVRHAVRLAAVREHERARERVQPQRVVVLRERRRDARGKRHEVRLVQHALHELFPYTCTHASAHPFTREGGRGMRTHVARELRPRDGRPLPDERAQHARERVLAEHDDLLRAEHDARGVAGQREPRDLRAPCVASTRLA